MSPQPTPALSQRWLFPLQERGVVVGFFLAVVAGALSWSLTIAVAWWVVAAIVGLLWRRGDPPILSLCLAYQWVFIITGYTVWHTTGAYPGLSLVGDLPRAVWVSLAGLLVLAIGIRLGQLVPQKPDRSEGQSKQKSPEAIYAIAPLFRLVILVFAINYFVEILPRAIFFGGAEIIKNVLSFRFVLLFLLLTTVARKRAGYSYGVVALGFVLVPILISSMSKFQTLLFYVILVLLHEWRPWLRLRRLKAYNRGVVTAIVALALLTFGLALFWVGGIKPVWRPALVSGKISGSPMQKLAAFADTAGTALGTFDAGESISDLSERVSSGLGYFSMVLERVPDVVPHAEGELTMIGLEHIAKPRIFFPNKRQLGSDSWIIWQYAGAIVAGEEQGTSVGLGYMGEFYIDFGMPWMFLELLLYGGLLGALYSGLSWSAPSRDFFKSTTVVIFVDQFMSYEGSFAKQLGGIVQAFLILSVLQYTAGAYLHRWLHRKTIGEAWDRYVAMTRGIALPGRR